MRADHWKPLDEAAAREVERLNNANLDNAVIALVTARLSQCVDGRHAPIPDEMVLRQLHQVGALFLVDRPGRYRRNDDARIVVTDKGHDVDEGVRAFSSDLGDAAAIDDHASWMAL